MARAEPAAEIAGAIADRHAAKMGAHAHHHQPFAGFVQCAVLVRSIGCRLAVRIARGLVGQIGQRHRTGSPDFISRTAADENRLAAPFHGQLRADLDTGNIDRDRCQSAGIRRGVHLVDQWPDRGSGGDCPRACGGVIQEIPAAA